MSRLVPWAILGLAAPIILWRFWKGEGFTIQVFSAVAILFGLPGFLLLRFFLAPLKKSMVLTGVKQGIVLLVGLAILNGVGMALERWSLKQSMKRGNVMAGRLEEYRGRKGIYPKSLDDLGPPWTRPTMGKRFDYSSEEKGFTLSFQGAGIMDSWYLHSRGEWHRD